MIITTDNEKDFIKFELGVEIANYLFDNFSEVHVGMIYSKDQTRQSLEDEHDLYPVKRSLVVDNIPTGEYAFLYTNLSILKSPQELPSIWGGGELKVEQDGHYSIKGLRIYSEDSYGLEKFESGNCDVNASIDNDTLKDVALIYWTPSKQCTAYSSIDYKSISVIRKYLSEIWSKCSCLAN